MLDNLQNADLGGLGGYIHYTYDSTSQMIPTMIIALGFLVIIFAIIFGIRRMVLGSTTNQYREKLVDLYVASTIRKFAKEDNLDLDAEYKIFKSEEKKQKLETQSLSGVVENELSEKVISAQEKKLVKK